MSKQTKAKFNTTAANVHYLVWSTVNIKLKSLTSNYKQILYKII